MRDSQRIVDEMRSFLLSRDHVLTDAIRELAASYGEACKDANARLRRCKDYLDKGLRSEAIQLAQAEPILLDEVAVLNFPERQDWDDMALVYTLPAAPKLQLDVAEDLNRAYAEEQPLENLLREHRRLALVRAPLVKRLTIMRQLAQLDRSNPVWVDDIRTFETARFRLMRTEVDQAAARDDTGVLHGAAEELEKSPWLVPPPAALVQQVRDAVRESVQKRVRAALLKVERDLNQAFQTQNLAQGQAARDRWNVLVQSSRLPADDPLRRHVKQALGWLLEEERRQAQELAYQTALAHLEDALDRGAVQQELMRLYNAVLAHHRGVPAPVAQRYKAELDRQVCGRRWLEWIILGLVFSVGLLLLMAFVAFLLYRSNLGL